MARGELMRFFAEAAWYPIRLCCREPVCRSVNSRLFFSQSYITGRRHPPDSCCFALTKEV